MKWSLLILLFCGVLPRQAKACRDHDIHVSVSEVQWNAEATIFEVSIKVFIDDLEASLSKGNTGALQIGTPKESAQANDLIVAYLQKHFHISLDGITLPVEFLGKETTEDYKAIWCYVQFTGIKEPKHCTITNDILFELYDDQRAIMDIRMSSTQKAYTILQPGQSSWSYTF